MTTQHSGERVGEGLDYAPGTTEEAAKALIKEAHQHRRRRLTIQGALVLFVTALVTLGVTLYMTGGPGAATTTNDPAPSALATSPICSLKNLAVVSNYSGGAAGTLYYNLVLTNSGGACLVAPLEARAYDVTTHAFVGTLATVLRARSYTAASKHALANQRLVHGAQDVAQLGYVDAAVGSSGCAVAKASELAIWTLGHAHVVKYVRLALAGSPLKVCIARSYLTLYWPVLRHVNA